MRKHLAVNLSNVQLDKDDGEEKHMLTPAKTLTSPVRPNAPFYDSVLRPKRHSLFSRLGADNTPSAVCYGMVALALLVGIAINAATIIYTMMSILGPSY